MDPIEVLMNEHRRIERALDALSAYAAAVASGGGRPEDLGRFVEFIRLFADRHHHGKEEDLLFVELVAQGFSRESGPVAVMLHEHDEGRGYVRTMAEAAEADAWDEATRGRVAEAAGSYVALLRQHIMKEDQVLYVMAQRRLGPEQQRRLAERVEAYEREHAGERERLEALGAELAAAYPAA